MTQETKEDVIEKVRKIMAKADPSRNDCEAEAANALRIAKRLMAEHGLDMADIEVSGEDAEDGNFNFVNCQNETEYKGFYVNHIINAVATITSTRAFRTVHHQADGRHIKYRVTFCGTETDAAVASAMFNMLLGMTKARARSFASQHGRTDRSFVKSYEEGFAHGLNQNAQAKVDLGSKEKNDCYALMVITKDKALENWMEKEHDLRAARNSSHGTRNLDATAYSHGKADAKSVNLDSKGMLN